MADIQASQPGVQAAFLCNQKGDVCIAFDDPAYVRADTIVIDAESASVHAVLHETALLVGHVSQAMMEAFGRKKTTLLTAVRPDGSIFEMMAPIAQEQGFRKESMV